MTFDTCRLVLGSSVSVRASGGPKFSARYLVGLWKFVPKIRPDGGSVRVVQRVLDWVFKRERENPDVPRCPSHLVPMQVRGVMGRPARFSYQTEETYTIIYFCPVTGCDETAEAELAMTQIPVPGAAPRRPDYARRD